MKLIKKQSGTIYELTWIIYLTTSLLMLASLVEFFGHRTELNHDIFIAQDVIIDTDHSDIQGVEISLAAPTVAA